MLSRCSHRRALLWRPLRPIPPFPPRPLLQSALRSPSRSARALSPACAQAGPLYQVKRADGKMLDIKVTAAGGFADAAAQDKFCSGSSCVFWTIYDQSPKGNHLGVAPAGGAHRQTDKPAPANAGPLTVGGHKVYGLRMDPPSGYRRDNTTDIAVDDEAETMYAVFNGSHYNNRCCFDYGNAETNNHDDGAGTMEAVYFGSAKGGLNHGGAGKGPWIMADMENALWGADRVVSNEEPINHDFVTGKRSAVPLLRLPLGA